jgi:large subunit ribosomal protein L10
MPSPKNIQIVERLKEKLAKAKATVLVDYRGLKVNQLTALRKKIKEAGGEFQVAKNTLLKLGFKDDQLTPSTEELNFPFEGPTAILFCFEDEVAPLKTLYEFFKENNLPEIKFGFLAKEALTKDKVVELAQLPPKPALQGKLISVINQPITGLVYALKGNLRQLINLLKNIQEKR